MMKDFFKKLNYIGFVVMMVIAMQAMATENDESAKKILLNSLYFSDNNAFKALVDNPFPIKFKDYNPPALVHVKPIQGKAPLLLVQMNMNELGQTEILINGSGRFIWCAGLPWIGKLDFTNNKDVDITRLLASVTATNAFWANVLNWTQDVEYTLTETIYDNLPCYKIEVRLPENDQTLAKISGLPIAKIASLRDKLLDNTPMLLVFIVGEDPNFCYSISLYTVKGKQLFSRNWRDVVIEEQDELIFYPKDDIEIKTIVSHTDLLRKLQESLSISTVSPNISAESVNGWISALRVILVSAGAIIVIGIVVAITLHFRKKQ